MLISDFVSWSVSPLVFWSLLPGILATWCILWSNRDSLSRLEAELPAANVTLGWASKGSSPKFGAVLLAGMTCTWAKFTLPPNLHLNLAAGAWQQWWAVCQEGVDWVFRNWTEGVGKFLGQAGSLLVLLTWYMYVSELVCSPCPFRSPTSSLELNYRRLWATIYRCWEMAPLGMNSLNHRAISPSQVMESYGIPIVCYG